MLRHARWLPSGRDAAGVVVKTASPDVDTIRSERFLYGSGLKLPPVAVKTLHVVPANEWHRGGFRGAEEHRSMSLPPDRPQGVGRPDVMTVSLKRR